MQSERMISLNGRLSEYPLSTLIGILHDRGATGDLVFQHARSPATLSFKEGKLLDARVGSLVGFQAIHYAMSLPDAVFSFDPLAAPPAELTISDSSQELIFNLLLRGSDQSAAHADKAPESGHSHPTTATLPVAENVRADTQTILAKTKSSAPQRWFPVTDPLTNSAKTRSLDSSPVDSLRGRGAGAKTSDQVESERQDVDPLTSPVEAPSTLFPIPAVDTAYVAAVYEHHRRPMRVARFAAPLVLVAVVVVAVVAFNGRMRSTAPTDGQANAAPVSPSPILGATGYVTDVSPEADAAASIDAPDDVVLPGGGQSRGYRANRWRTKNSRTFNGTSQPGERVAAGASAASAPAPVAPAGKAVDAKAKGGGDSGADTVTVVMKVVNGRVAQASIANPRPGREAYEASALRMARQRRFASTTDGRETLQIKLKP